MGSDGDVMCPTIFSLFWFMQTVLNFIIGTCTALFRLLIVMLTSIMSCCFVDITTLPERLVGLDSAYYSLLSMAYTQHERRNPIKKAFVTSLVGQVHRVFGPKRNANAGGCHAQGCCVSCAATVSPQSS